LRRSIRGISAVLLPVDDSGAIDWEGFAAHVDRTVAAGIVPAVNMDTGHVHRLDGDARRRVLGVAREVIGPAVPGDLVAGACVVDGEGDVSGAVNFGQGDDFVDVDAGVEAAGGELLVVGFGPGTEGVEGQEPFGVAGTAALVEEFFDVVGVLEVAVALVAAGVGGDEVVGVIEAEAAGEGVKGHQL
jgi:hypothetical protein